MQRPQRKHHIIVNLEYNQEINRYIPLPYLVKAEKDGSLGSLTAKATAETVPSYDLMVDDSISAGIIARCDALSLHTLTEKYTTSKRTHNTLQKVLQIKEAKGLIQKYYDRLSDELMLYLLKNEICCIVGIIRKTRLEELKITIQTVPLTPILKFDKTQTGIKYSLALTDSTGVSILPHTRDIHILSNNTPWIILGYKIYPIEHINGNKLRPFLKSDHIFIKKEMVATYFEKFIIEVARKTEIEATGFEVQQKSDILSCTLVTSYDVLTDRMIADLEFQYDGATFRRSSDAMNRVRLHTTLDNEVHIVRISRDLEAEKKWTIPLLKKGMITTPASRLAVEGQDDMELLSWLSENHDSLTNAGYQIDTPTHDGHALSLAPRSISIRSDADGDWFDIHGSVNIGDERIPFAQLLQHIKRGDRYFPLADGTYFVIPQTWMTKYEELAKFGIGDGDHVKIKKSQYAVLEDLEDTSQSVTIHMATIEEVTYVPSTHLRATLRPYQTEGVRWLINHQRNGLGACLADDMGLGKTLQTIALLSYTKDQIKEKTPEETGQLTLFAERMESEIRPLRALIILPSSLVFNWYEEIRKFNNTLHVLQYIGAKRKDKRDSLDKFDITLTTYHTVLRDVEHLRKVDWEYIILDESQAIKNKDSKMFRSINELPARNRMSLSGTPIENSLSDLWSQMQFINPDMLGSFSFFKTHYLTPIERHGDVDALHQLSRLIHPYILRRTKEQVAKDLPPLTESVQYIEMDSKQTEVYDKVKSATRNHILGLDDSDRSYKFHVFAALTKLRQIANAPSLVDDTYDTTSEKCEHIYQKIVEIKKSGHKVLIFSSFTMLIDLFTAKCAASDIKHAVLTGASSQKERQAAVRAFQNDADTTAFFISLKAGGTGLNLTAADYVFILDPWWNPFAEKQAIARAHRIGQEHPVSVIRFISKNTIEEKILALQHKKTSLSDSIIHFDEEKLALDKNDFVELLQ